MFVIKLPKSSITSISASILLFLIFGSENRIFSNESIGLRFEIFSIFSIPISQISAAVCAKISLQWNTLSLTSLCIISNTSALPNFSATGNKTPLSGPINTCPPDLTTIAFRLVPIPGSITIMCTHSGNCGIISLNQKAAVLVSPLGNLWLMSIKFASILFNIVPLTAPGYEKPKSELNVIKFFIS